MSIWLPPEAAHTGSRDIDCKTYSGQAKRIMMGVWSYLKQFMYTKFVIVVDEDIDARKWKTLWAISTNVDAARILRLSKRHRLSGFCIACRGSRLENGNRRDGENRCGNGSRMGQKTPHERRYYQRGHAEMA